MKIEFFNDLILEVNVLVHLWANLIFQQLPERHVRCCTRRRPGWCPSQWTELLADTSASDRTVGRRSNTDQGCCIALHCKLPSVKDACNENETLSGSVLS